jgi:hypothetical protein
MAEIVERFYFGITRFASSGKDDEERYVRESDYAALNEKYEGLLLHSQEYDELAKNYAALLERHRRMVKAAELKRNVIILQGRSRAVFTGEWIAIPKDDFDALKAALAEEVDYGKR